jgi:hypothetical protein
VHHDNGPHPVCLCTGQRFGQSAPLRIGRCLFPEARARSRGSGGHRRRLVPGTRAGAGYLPGGEYVAPCGKIVLRGQLAVVGYVLVADPRYATVLRAADATVQILQLDDVESRTICRLNPGLESASLVRYLAGLETHTPVLARTPWRSWPCPVPGARASGHGGQHAPADTEGQRARRTGSGWPHAGCEGLARTVRSSVRC